MNMCVTLALSLTIRHALRFVATQQNEVYNFVSLMLTAAVRLRVLEHLG